MLSKADYLGSLENSIMSDINARTSIEDHNLCLDYQIGQLSPDTNSIQDGNRCFCSHEKSSYGRILLKLCNNHKLTIANGQTPGDTVGNYICFDGGGASVVYYLLVESSIQQKVENLKILPPEFDSKHTTITTTFSINTINNAIGKLL